MIKTGDGKNTPSTSGGTFVKGVGEIGLNLIDQAIGLGSKGLEDALYKQSQELDPGYSPNTETNSSALVGGFDITGTQMLIIGVGLVAAWFMFKK